MKISNEQIDTLLQMLALTKDDETDCGDCLVKLAEFAENSLKGNSIPEGLRRIEEHLRICADCCEEFEALKIALAGDDSN